MLICSASHQLPLWCLHGLTTAFKSEGSELHLLISVHLLFVLHLSLSLLLSGQELAVELAKDPSFQFIVEGDSCCCVTHLCILFSYFSLFQFDLTMFIAYGQMLIILYMILCVNLITDQSADMLKASGKKVV